MGGFPPLERRRSPSESAREEARERESTSWDARAASEPVVGKHFNKRNPNDKTFQVLPTALVYIYIYIYSWQVLRGDGGSLKGEGEK